MGGFISSIFISCVRRSSPSPTCPPNCEATVRREDTGPLTWKSKPLWQACSTSRHSKMQQTRRGQWSQPLTKRYPPCTPSSHFTASQPERCFMRNALCLVAQPLSCFSTAANGWLPSIPTKDHGAPLGPYPKRYDQPLHSSLHGVMKRANFPPSGLRSLV